MLRQLDPWPGIIRGRVQISVREGQSSGFQAERSQHSMRAINRSMLVHK